MKQLFLNIFKEIYNWLFYFLSCMPGKLGVNLRIIFISLTRLKYTKISSETGLKIIGLNNIEFKKNINIGMNSYINAEKSFIQIGNNFNCNCNLHLNASGGGKIIIGDDVLIGPNVVFRTSNHNFKNKNLQINKQGSNFANIHVNDNVWIGANCVILSWVEIGKGSVIAAGAVVNKNVNPFTIVGGVPAKTIKKISH